jgi:16S rRNA (guanine(966)-N(2))-methyltransferase RsmD
MRIISGTARGRRLKTLEGMDVRPTTEKVKEAIFSAIQFDLPQATVLDLFAGSGQLGLEALSRGAKQAYFVDHSPKSLSVVRENIAAAGFAEQAEVIQTEATAFLRSLAPTVQFDLVFLDPPYRHDTIQEILPLLDGKLTPDGKIICEHERELTLPDSISVWKKKKTYTYSSIAVTVYIYEEEVTQN